MFLNIGKLIKNIKSWSELFYTNNFIIAIFYPSKKGKNSIKNIILYIASLFFTLGLYFFTSIRNEYRNILAHKNKKKSF